MAAPATVIERTDPRAKLSRDQIIARARQVLREEGIDALTMRRLATDLGVAPMTLYTYVRDKDELLDAVVQATARELPLPARRGSWKTQMRGLMRSVHAMLVENRFMVQLRLRGPIVGPEALKVNEAGLRILGEAGFSRAEAARGYRSLLVLTFGFAGFGPPAVSHANEAAVDAAIGSLPAAEYPYLTAARRETVATHAPGTGLFEFTLDRALDGLERRLRQPRA